MLVCLVNDFCIFNGYIDCFMFIDNWIYGNFICSCYFKFVGNFFIVFLQFVFFLFMFLGFEIGYDMFIFSFFFIVVYSVMFIIFVYNEFNFFCLGVEFKLCMCSIL